ncbi:choice-of-anchor B family protein [Rhodohalobacter sp. SW132]|uniref:choice-of-anchor B family protein n=1 Tax=Rhodohalobacter sp. SW132 TaxID=2293433 RepID=UPI000E285DBB|nr:choice-of-anchor B family protein [Rhodohalobacter sp. SW132]REL38496.1 choice-of-anchor B family protein [Rhodohalobacter sp. SW132]
MFRYLHLSLIFILVLLGCSTSSDSEKFEYTACENGTSEGYPCSNIDFYAHLTPEDLGGDRLNDIWGWIDPETGREYALVGLTDGISFVDVSNPAEPVVVGKLLESTVDQQQKHPPLLAHPEEGEFKDASDWRDMKVYQNTMYVVSEQGTHGMQVFDLTRLRNVQNPPEEFREDYLYSRFGNAHNIAINEESGYAYVIGATTGEICASNGGLHIINLHENPMQPTYAGCHVEPDAGGVIRDGYIHDTQCVIYNGPDSRYSDEEICFSSAELTFLISGVTDKENPVTISNTAYEGAEYSHQGWLTEDQRYFFMNDELDEIRNGINTRTLIWDVMNLEEPELIGYYEHDTIAVTHNLYIRGDLMYQANYTAGLRILDVSSPLPQDVRTLGYFNTTPLTNQPVFAGLWSVYPYLHGDKILVSDIENGLFVLRYSR